MLTLTSSISLLDSNLRLDARSTTSKRESSLILQLFIQRPERSFVISQASSRLTDGSSFLPQSFLTSSRRFPHSLSKLTRVLVSCLRKDLFFQERECAFEDSDLDVEIGPKQVRPSV